MCISSLIWNLSCTIVYNKHTTKLRLIGVSYTFFSHNSFICCLLFYLTYYNVGSLYAFLYEKGNVHNYRPTSVTCSIQTFWYLFSDNLCKQYANFHSFAQTLTENTPLDDEWMKIIFFLRWNVNSSAKFRVNDFTKQPNQASSVFNICEIWLGWVYMTVNIR